MKKVFILALAAALLCGCMKDFDEDIHGDPYSDTEIGFGPVVHFDNLEFERFCLDSLDIDGDGCIRAGEIADVRKIDCSGRGMTSLEGIEKFPSLDTLVCQGNRLESLNLSQTSVRVLFANPMNDSSGKNLLKYVYVRRDQEIEYVTSDRDKADRIPSETIVISIPASRDGE